MNVDEVIKKYVAEQMGTYRLLSEKTQELLSSILSSNGIVSHSITNREKDPEKLREKITIETKDYDNPLNQITDLAGVRIITYFPSDMDKIVPLIEKEFKVDPKHSVDKRFSSDPAIFGYASVHLVAQFIPERLKLPEYALFKGMKCEIQVRTILQHAWAEIEHDLGFKTQNAVPRQIRRHFSRLAGLLELADDEFIRIRNELSDYETNIAQMIANSPNKVRLDQSSLLVYLKSSQLVHKVNGEIERATHTILDKPHFLQDTLRRLRYLGFKTIADINTALTTHKKQIVHFAKGLMVPAGVEKGYYPTDVCLFYLC